MESKSKHAKEYRQEILSPLFKRIMAGESCCIAGVASMGKTRLQDFMMHPETVHNYLGEDADRVLILRVDCNRLIQRTDWGFYELLLTSIIEACMDHPLLNQRYAQFNEWRTEVIRNDKALLALRMLELAVLTLVRKDNMILSFMFDEFDENYKEFPKHIFSSLRAIRDANKNKVAYIVFMRDFPDQIRDPKENEGFHELISAFAYGLTPYNYRDIQEMFGILETRRDISLSTEEKDVIERLAGGHPGLIMALVNLVENYPGMFQGNANLNRIDEIATVKEECRKLIASLSELEQQGIKQVVGKEQVDPLLRNYLVQKGLIFSNGNGPKVTIPILIPYVQKNL